MPARNILKPYVVDGFYHLYNRGVEKRDIFLDEGDYRVFLNNLKLYLLPKEKILKDLEKDTSLTVKEKAERIFLISRQQNFFGKIELLAYVLLPNHFHFLLRQKEERAIESFMRSLSTKYVSYFNQRYQRIGPLFQGRYKGILIDKEEYFIHLSRYIHTNPEEILPKKKIDRLSLVKLSSICEKLASFMVKKRLSIIFFQKNARFWIRFLSRICRRL